MQQLDIIAVRQRTEISSWIKKDLATASCKEYIKRHFALETLTSKKSWKQIIQDAGKKAKDYYTSEVDIEKINEAVQKYLAKSPAQEILKSKAYAWLKYIQKHRPSNAWWFPHYAIEVAHKAFRLGGTMATFKKYLSHAARRKGLSWILRGAVFWL